MNREQLEPIVEALRDHADNPKAVAAVIWSTLERCDIKPGWRANLTKLALFAEMLPTVARPCFSVITEGNIKEPFLSFSGMPGFGFCPGSGDCRIWCYSFSAWRYPAAFCRQAQNTLLLSSELGRQAIASELGRMLRRPKYSKLDRVDFRLYVDGDFRDAADVQFWMDLIGKTSKLAAYGYSKSFHELLAYDVMLSITGKQWPSNYVLNVSSGHRHSPQMVDAIEALPITRGRFVAVPMPKRAKHSEHGEREHQQALRKAYGKRAFTCPGKCGECTPSGHACGSERFKGVDIIIATH